MQKKAPEYSLSKVNRIYITIGGIALILIGAVILLDQSLQTGWLAQAILPMIGLIFLVGGIRTRQLKLIIPGSVITGLGIGLFIFLSIIIETTWSNRVGLGLFAFGMGWWLVTLLTAQFSSKTAWWALIPGGVISSLGACFIYSPMRVVDFVLYIVTTLGLMFIIWGAARNLFGLIIPGALLISIGPSIYLAWGFLSELNALTRTGVMLVGFALGWLLITILSRLLTEKFVWWPMIPAGVLAMVGWGLYIGGNPENAAAFIGNTGSIGLILFGIYLLLLRKGIKG